MDAKALSLAATLNDAQVDYYTIPQYQRPYTWEKDNFETLWEDLQDSYAEYRVAIQNHEAPESYFLGPVVFVRNQARRSFDIIDGQQRTTTFHILLWYLYRKATDETEQQRLFQILTFLGRESKLRVSGRDAATFLHIKESDDEPEGTSKMAVCARYFKDKIEALADPNEFSQYIREQTQFIVIVADDYGKAWDLFIGINGKGEPLNPTDLVKAFVCGTNEVGEAAGAIWEEKILRLDKDSTPFLLFLARFKAKKFVSENALFREITRQFPQTTSTLDISTNSDVYYLFWHKAIEEIENEVNGLTLTLESKKAIRTLRDLDRKDFTTLLFQYADAFGLKSIFEESFLKPIASFQIRMAISRKRSRERKFITQFREVNFKQEQVIVDQRSMEEKATIDKTRVIELIKTFLRNEAPDNVTCATFIKLSDYNNATARVILQQYEQGIRGNRLIQGFQIEHLMPQTGTPYWFGIARTKDAEEYGKIVNNIGNLFVIDAETNNSVKNFAFDVKKSFYQQYLQDWSIARITRDKDEWVNNDIVTRAQEIATWATNHWTI